MHIFRPSLDVDAVKSKDDGTVLMKQMSQRRLNDNDTTDMVK